MTAVKAITEKSKNLEDLLEDFGLFKPYHLLLSLLCLLAFMSNSFYCSNYIFAAEEVTYRCLNPPMNISYCGSANSSLICTEWEYDNPNSFVAEFQLACQDWKRTLVGTTHSFGYMVGLLIVGPLSDRIGRKPTVVVTGVLGGVFGLMRSFSNWYWFYIAMEFMEAAIGDICSPMYVLSLEIVSTKKRLPFMMLGNIGYIIGGIVLALIAWLVPYWRTFLQVIYTPALLFFFYKYFLDESPRWLLTRGKKEEAVAIIENAAKKNAIKIEKQTLERLSCEDQQSIALGSLIKTTFKSSTLRRRFFVCLVWWTTSTFVNYGMVINSVSLEGNKYVNFGLTALVDLPGTFVITYILIHFKRKIPLILSFIAAAVLCISQPFMPTHLPWLSITVYMAGKVMSSFYFNITYLYTSELFPTYTRNSMHALCSSLGRIGSIIAPQTPLLMVYWDGLPSLIFGIASLFAGLVTLLVPDVSNDALPDTVRQAEALGKSKAKEALGHDGDTKL